MSTGVVTLFGGLYLVARIETRFDGQISQHQTEAASHAEEVLVSIQNVKALGAEQKLLRKYGVFLDAAKRLSIRKSLVSGVKFTLSYFILLSSYSLAFWYGTRLLHQQMVNNSGDVIMYALKILQPLYDGR